MGFILEKERRFYNEFIHIPIFLCRVCNLVTLTDFFKYGQIVNILPPQHTAA
jgi:3-deoxy-D-manno-octulosonic acid (KDO) 8-phosphate synthase